VLKSRETCEVGECVDTEQCLRAAELWVQCSPIHGTIYERKEVKYVTVEITPMVEDLLRRFLMRNKILTIASVCLVLMLAILPLSCGEVEPTPTPEPGQEPTPGPGTTPVAPPTEEPQYGGTLRICLAFGPSTFGDPVKEQKYGYGGPMDPAIERLICYSEKEQLPEPKLATGWEVADDLKSITFTLRKGVKFHDGTPFNAEAAKWNLDRFSVAPRPQLAMVSSVDIIDEYTIRLNIPEWNNMIFQYLCQFSGRMISPTSFQEHGQAWAEMHPVGTGPFKFVSYEPDVNIVYERFDDYWQEGKPYLDGIEFIIIADTMVAMAAFQAGEVDVKSELSANDIATLEAAGKYNILVGNPNHLKGLMFDAGSNPEGPFGDIRVRQAVCHAIDAQAIVDSIGKGVWTYSNQIARPGMWAWSPDVVGYPYNPEKARELLTEAGFPNGFKTKLGYELGPREFSYAYEAAANYLGEVGIDAEVEPLPGEKATQVVVGGGYDGICFLFAPVEPDELRTIYQDFTGFSIVWPSGLHPKEVADLATRAVSTGDMEERAKLTRDLQVLIIDKYCLTFSLFITSRIYAVQPQVHDHGMGYTGGNQTWYKTWIEK